MAQTYVATINPGLELALVSELRELGAKKISPFEGGVSFRVTKKNAYHIIKHVRCANQVRLRVDEFRARDIHELFRKIKRIEWSRLLPERSNVTFRVATRTSRVNDTRIIRRTAIDAFDGLGYVVKDDGLEILVRLEDDRCSVSLDASGRELFKRGYRLEQVAAPIRESLASAVVRLSGATNFTDPCCGSGTLLIEHAMSVAGLPPRPDRKYPVERWADFDRELFDTQKLEPSDEIPTLRGFDRNAKAIEISMENAKRAGVEKFISFEVRDVAELEPDVDVVSNPPYDLRMKDSGFAVINQLDKHAGATFIVPGQWRGDGKVLARFQNGGVPVKLVRSSAFPEAPPRKPKS